MEKIIIEQNPWWKNKEAIKVDEKVVNAMKRKHKLVYSFKEKGNFIFIGPRQIGKTTFFKLLIYDLLINKKVNPKEICYFSCELLENYKDIVEVIRKFFVLAKPKYIFLDEVSYVKGWHRAIKYLLDSGIVKGSSLYITGSSSVELKKEKFPGRNIKIKNFYPLNFRRFVEIFASKELKSKLKNIKINFRNVEEVFEKAKILIPFSDELEKLFYIFINSGGFPRAFYELVEEGKIKEETYEIYWNWLINDIAKLERSEKITIGILKGIIKNYTTKFSANSIAKETEIGSHVTVRDYLELLEDLMIISNFYNFDFNKKTVVFRKMRKTYFKDPFILHTCNFKIFGMPYEDKSKIVEGIVVENLIRKFGKLNIGFLHNRKEIDACFDNFAIEVKWQEKVNYGDFPKTNIKNKILVSKNQFEFIKEKNLVIIPAFIFSALY